MASQIVLTGGRTLSYEYDAEERITKVTDSLEGVTEYTYDALGQLLTENVNNTVVNTMTYDNYGNIRSKNGVTYTYGNGAWKDLLTGYNGLSVIYDAQGNPTNYLGHPLTWEKGRQLKSFDNIQYTYNANGIRTSKTVCGVRHRYTLDGTKVLREEWSDNTLVPLYDNEDGVCGVIYNNEPFYFQKNLQGDVIAIYDRNTEVVARYTYDAWGKVLSVRDGNGADVLGCCEHIAVVNPYRYRSYYYDEELGIYYLQSRYYDPTVGRFINGDEATCIKAIEKTNQHSLFSYCNNNAVNITDNNGASFFYLAGCGLQIEISTKHFTFGVEFVWYFYQTIRRGRPALLPYVYFYGGFGLSADITDFISKITKDPSLLLNPQKAFKTSGSVSLFAIFAYSGLFSGPKDYEGGFTGVSLAIRHIKSYTSWSQSCFVVGIGYSTSWFSASSGETWYALSSTLFAGMEKIYDTVQRNTKTLKC